MIRAKLFLLIFLIPWLLSCENSSDDSTVTMAATIVASPTQVDTVADLSTSEETPYYHSTTEELLLMWGKTEWAERDCMLWVVNPVKHPPARLSLQETYCFYENVRVGGTQHIMGYSLHHPTRDNPLAKEIALFEFSEGGSLVLHQKISLGQIHLTDTPQWARDGSVYFSGIVEGKEQIYQLDSESGKSVPYINSTEGFATSPKLSPSGRYLAYQVWENHDSREDCGQLTCNSRYYFLHDIEKGKNIPLLPIVASRLPGNTNFMHCDLMWSPSGHYLAFAVGCGLQEPGAIVILNADSLRVVDVVNAVEPDGHVAKSEWLSENHLVLNGHFKSTKVEDVYEGYALLSMSPFTFRILEQIPRRNKYDYDLVSINDWTPDGSTAVGQTQVPAEKRTTNLVVVPVDDENNTPLYVQTPGEYVEALEWSASGDLIAYRTFDWENRNAGSRVIMVDRHGNTVADTGLLDIISPQYMWVSVER